LESYFKVNVAGMVELSLVEINKMCWTILDGFEPFMKWNECKIGKTPDIGFTSRYDGKEDPDYDFIDLDALLHNVCLDIRQERRESVRFSKEFEEEQKENNA
jgi:hypothetical protein